MTGFSEHAAGARKECTPAARRPRLARPAQRGRQMPFLAGPACPICGGPLPARLVWTMAATQTVRCSRCQTRLHLRPSRVAVAASIIVVFSLYVGLWLAQRVAPENAQATIVSALVVGVLVAVRYAAGFARAEVPPPKMDVDFAGEDASTVTERSETDLDDRQMLERLTWQQRIAEPGRQAWRCLSCREQNPSTFDVC